MQSEGEKREVQSCSASRVNSVGVAVVEGVVRVAVGILWVPLAVRESLDRASLQSSCHAAFNAPLVSFVSSSGGITLRHGTRDRGKGLVAACLEGVGDMAWEVGLVVRGEAWASDIALAGG